MAWWKKALKVGGAAAQGYDQAAHGGLSGTLGRVTGSLVKKKKAGWNTLGDDPADEAESKERYGGTNWEDTERADW